MVSPLVLVWYTSNVIIIADIDKLRFVDSKIEVHIKNMGEKYCNFENVLNTIHRKYISLKEDEVRRNNEIISAVMDQILNEMKKDSLFKELDTNKKFYGGSYYDGLKIGKPEEFDIDLPLKLPKYWKPRISFQPGYLSVMFEAPDELSAKFKKLMVNDANYLSTAKVRAWMKSVFVKALNNFPKENGRYILEAQNDYYTIKTSESGPAMTLILMGTHTKISIDFVPCFELSGDKWPTNQGYRENPFYNVQNKNTFFIVPKSPPGKTNAYNEMLWRLSFQEQERELIRGMETLKPTLKLFKQLRDALGHKMIKSYFIKTIFLWVNEENGRCYWGRTKTETFFEMLKKYIEYIKKDIPYFWNEAYLLLDIPRVTKDQLINRLVIVEKDLLRKYETDPFIICRYLGCPITLEDVQMSFNNSRVIAFKDNSSDEYSTDDEVVSEGSQSIYSQMQHFSSDYPRGDSTLTAHPSTSHSEEGLSGFAKLAIGVGLAATLGYGIYKGISYSNTKKRKN